ICLWPATVTALSRLFFGQIWGGDSRLLFHQRRTLDREETDRQPLFTDNSCTCLLWMLQVGFGSTLFPATFHLERRIFVDGAKYQLLVYQTVEPHTSSLRPFFRIRTRPVFKSWIFLLEVLMAPYTSKFSSTTRMGSSLS